MNAVLDGDLSDARILIISDHASASLPDDIDLGLSPSHMRTHIAVDIGVSEIASMLSRRPDFACVKACWSRLLVDTNRCPTDRAVIPEKSDGIAIAGNALPQSGRVDRLKRYHDSFHDAVTDAIDRAEPKFLLFLHSFTPKLAHEAERRPWEVGLLYNHDRRAADLAMAFFRDQEFCVGDQQPYSGLIYNYSFVRHGEARGLPHLLLEIRQDLISDVTGQAHFADIVADLAQEIVEKLA